MIISKSIRKNYLETKKRLFFLKSYIKSQIILLLFFFIMYYFEIINKNNNDNVTNKKTK